MTNKQAFLLGTWSFGFWCFSLFWVMTASFRDSPVEIYLIAAIPVGLTVVLRAVDGFNLPEWIGRWSSVSLGVFGVSCLFTGVSNGFVPPLIPETETIVEGWIEREKVFSRFEELTTLTIMPVFGFLASHIFLAIGAWRTNKARRYAEIVIAAFGILIVVATMSVRECVLASGIVALMIAIRNDIWQALKNQGWRNESSQFDMNFLSRRFVLYLRPFRNDNYILPSRKSISVNIRSVLSAIFGSRSVEQEFVLHMEHGATEEDKTQVVAIGKPREELPPLGALRLRYSDDEWQPAVINMIKNSSAVVLVPDGTDAVNWETIQLFKHAMPTKVVVWPQGAAQAYASWRKSAVSILGCELPETAPYLLLFQDGWQPQILKKPAGYLAGLDRKSAIDLADCVKRMIKETAVAVAEIVPERAK